MILRGVAKLNVSFWKSRLHAIFSCSVSFTASEGCEKMEEQSGSTAVLTERGLHSLSCLYQLAGLESVQAYDTDVKGSFPCLDQFLHQYSEHRSMLEAVPAPAQTIVESLYFIGFTNDWI